MSRAALPIDQLAARSIDGDRRSTGRLLTLAERGGPSADEVAALTQPHAHAAHVIGITGAPGAGKSTLVAQLVETFTTTGSRPAVLAVDPSSPLTGGAILGDRVRMAAVDTTAFIRSVATRGHAGGLALAIPGGVRVLAAAGYDPVIIETVGVGQVEVDVTAAADTTIVVVTPGMGDAVQANKAGLLEVADIFVVNKADRPGASDTRRDLELMLELSHVTGQEDARHRPPILMCNSLTGDGVDEVVTAAADHLSLLRDTDQLQERRHRRTAFEIRTRATLAFESQLDAALADEALQSVIADAAAGTITPAEAAVAVRRQLPGAPDL